MPIQICRLCHIYHIWRSSVQSTTSHIFHFTFPATVDLINTVHSRMSLFSPNKQKSHVTVGTFQGPCCRDMSGWRLKATKRGVCNRVMLRGTKTLWKNTTIVGDVTGLQQRHHPENIPHLLNKIKGFPLGVQETDRLLAESQNGMAIQSKWIVDNVLFFCMLTTKANLFLILSIQHLPMTSYVIRSRLKFLPYLLRVLQLLRTHQRKDPAKNWSQPLNYKKTLSVWVSRLIVSIIDTTCKNNLKQF